MKQNNWWAIFFVFSIFAAALPSSGQEIEVLHSFQGPDGANPWPVVFGSDGNLYGTTYGGGGSISGGTVFRMTPGGIVTTLAIFDGSNGRNPYSQLLQSKDGSFYGVTSRDAVNGPGRVFRVSPNGSLTTVVQFTGQNGNTPVAELIQGKDGNLYGTTDHGGEHNFGTVFRLNPDGEFTSLLSFNDSNGSLPDAALVDGLDGYLYGTTYSGGLNGMGTVFKVTLNGSFTSLASFNAASGYGPVSSLTLGPDGNFYGTAVSGGDSNFGTVYRISPAGELKRIAAFTGNNGKYPRSGLIIQNGNFYGTTSSGGSDDMGTLFRMTSDGVITTLASFATGTGTNPKGGALTISSDGAIYGTTTGGGAFGLGTVYRIRPPSPPSIISQPANAAIVAGSSITLSVVAAGSKPFSYQWFKDGKTLLGATNSTLLFSSFNTAASGTYTVLVTNPAGTIASNPANLLAYEIQSKPQLLQKGSKLVGSGAIGASAQGNRVAISADGKTAVVGGLDDDPNGSGYPAGAVWVWSKNGEQWIQQGTKLVGSGANGNAFQGASVALSADGNTLIVGGPFDSYQGNNNPIGAAWVWTRSGDVWTQQGPKLVGSGADGVVRQGISVALSADGNTAIIGGLDEVNTPGGAWVWTRTAGVWTQQGPKLVGSNYIGISRQGESVALSADGNTALVGGTGDNNRAGAVWVWTRTAGVWTQQGPKLVGSNGTGNTGQGSFVSISADGNTAIVGGPGDDELGNNNPIGAAWIWTRNAGAWTQQGSKLVGLEPNGLPAVSSAQGSVSLSADGNTALVGGANDSGGVGAIWVWKRNQDVWRQTGPKLVCSDAIGKPYFGASASLAGDGNTAIIGGLGDNNYAGAAWIFDVPIPPTIINQPVAQSVNEGKDAIFTVTTKGTPPFSYQWRKDGLTISSATNSTLTQKQVTAESSGDYSVIVSNLAASVTSATARLFVYQSPTTPPPSPPKATPATDPVSPGLFAAPRKPTSAQMAVFTGGGLVDSNKMTIVLTHGWKGNAGDWPKQMAMGMIDQGFDASANIVGWDWSEDANQRFPSTAAARTPQQGTALGDTLLTTLGSGYSKPIHFLGHSLGTLVNCHAADYLHGDTSGSPGKFNPQNTQVTLFDEAELVSLLDPIHFAAGSNFNGDTADFFIENPWVRVIPKQSAWIDNYVSLVGVLHTEASNVLLWRGAQRGIESAHGYSYLWYSETVAKPFNGLMGSRWSLERNSLSSAPARGSRFVQALNSDPFTPEVVQIESTTESAIVYPSLQLFRDLSALGNSILGSYLDGIQYAGEFAENTIEAFNPPSSEAVFVGSADSTPAYFLPPPAASGLKSEWDLQVSVKPSLIPSGPTGTKHLPKPAGVGGDNGLPDPIFISVPVSMPQEAVGIAFQFRIEGAATSEYFTMGISNVNYLTMEARYLQDATWTATSISEISAYSGQPVRLFFGLNAVDGPPRGKLSIRGIRFLIPPTPSLNSELHGSNMILTWPSSTTGWRLETTEALYPTITWKPATNPAVVSGYHYAVTNEVSIGTQFFRLAR